MKDRYRLYVFDADGTLRRCTVPGQPCPNAPGEWELLPGVRERLARIDWSATALGILSNQGGVALGYLTEAMAYQLLHEMVEAAVGPGSITWLREAIVICPHAPEPRCPCRKPSALGLSKIMALYGVGPEDTLYVGDQESDRQCAKNGGVEFMTAEAFFGFERDGAADLARADQAAVGPVHVLGPDVTSQHDRWRNMVANAPLLSDRQKAKLRDSGAPS